MSNNATSDAKTRYPPPMRWSFERAINSTRGVRVVGCPHSRRIGVGNVLWLYTQRDDSTGLWPTQCGEHSSVPSSVGARDLFVWYPFLDLALRLSFAR
jgi:hypothetical protein